MCVRACVRACVCVCVCVFIVLGEGEGGQRNKPVNFKGQGTRHPFIGLKYLQIPDPPELAPPWPYP